VRGAWFTNRVYMRLETQTAETSDRDRILAAVESITNVESETAGGCVEVSVRRTPRTPVTRNDPPFCRGAPAVFWWLLRRAVLDLFHGCPHRRLFDSGSTNPGKWDHGAKKGGNILEHLPTNHSPKFAPTPELTIATDIEMMALVTLSFL
jgi:hypothetical protein